MSTPLSMDLRIRVLAAVASGLSHRQVGERFAVSAASVSRWRALEREHGDASPKPMGGDQRSHAIEAHGALILSLYEARPDITLQELRAVLEERGVMIGYGGLWRFFKRCGITVKKTAHAAEQQRPDVLRWREAWFDSQLDLDPARLVFIDETWASTNMARTRGRAPRGQRLRAAIPQGHWKTTTFVAGLRQDGIIAPFVLDGPINRHAFETYVAKVLMPELRPGDIVIMDNLSSHKGPRVRELIEAAGASLRHLPPYSPDFNPIENAFAKLKALLRRAAERTIGALWDRISIILDAFTPAECTNYFAAAGYDAV
jgi:transposase